MIELTVKDRIGYLTLNRPKLNVINHEMISLLAESLDKIEESDARVMIVRGADGFFSAGADIKEMSACSEEQLENASHDMHRVLNRIEGSAIPFIAVIDKGALGGGLELAMSCHMRYTVNDAKLGLPEFSLGLIPGYAGTRRLINIIGKARALELILNAKVIDGAESSSIGLVNKSFESTAEMDEYIQTMVNQMCDFSLHSIQSVMTLASIEDVHRNEENEAALFGEIFSTENAIEGINAFMEKRTAKFN